MAERKPKGKPGPKPDPERARSVIFSMRCRAVWRDWLARYAEWKGTDVSSLVDLALIEKARRDGFPEMPPER